LKYREEKDPRREGNSLSVSRKNPAQRGPSCFMKSLGNLETNYSVRGGGEHHAFPIGNLQTDHTQGTVPSLKRWPFTKAIINGDPSVKGEGFSRVELIPHGKPSRNRARAKERKSFCIRTYHSEEKGRTSPTLRGKDCY